MKIPNEDKAMAIMMLGLGVMCFAIAFGIVAMVLWSFAQ